MTLAARAGMPGRGCVAESRGGIKHNGASGSGVSLTVTCRPQAAVAAPLYRTSRIRPVADICIGFPRHLRR